MSGNDTDDPGLCSIVYSDPGADIEPLAGPMAGAGGPVPEVGCGHGRGRVFGTTGGDRIEQVRDVPRRIEFVVDAGGVARTGRRRFHIRCVFKPEMELLLRAAGFERWTIRPPEVRPGNRPAVVDRAPRGGGVPLWTARTA